VAYVFPSQSWVTELIEVLNSDDRYAEIARNWEGDLIFVIEPDEAEEPQARPARIYLDLWHGRCRGGRLIDEATEPVPKARYVLSAPRSNFLKILSGELDAMQAMLTRKLRVEGSLAYMLRNVPTVLDFVRCARRVEIAA
jgi:putative sterol carrier protein